MMVMATMRMVRPLTERVSAAVKGEAGSLRTGGRPHRRRDTAADRTGIICPRTRATFRAGVAVQRYLIEETVSPRGMRIHIADLTTKALPEGKRGTFTFYCPDTNRWDRANLIVRVGSLLRDRTGRVGGFFYLLLFRSRPEARRGHFSACAGHRPGASPPGGLYRQHPNVRPDRGRSGNPKHSAHGLQVHLRKTGFDRIAE